MQWKCIILILCYFDIFFIVCMLDVLTAKFLNPALESRGLNTIGFLTILKYIKNKIYKEEK